MRTTTELTARFDLAITTLPVPSFAENCDAPLGSIEYWEAFERDQAREDIDLLDVLDFDTVPFESVEADLSLELYAQDAAEERAVNFSDHTCSACGDEPWDDEALQKVGRVFYCAKCYKSALRNHVFTVEQAHKLNEQDRKRNYERYSKMSSALRTAIAMRPDLNWEPYKRTYGIW